jgi:hypothetical protein
MATTKVEVVAQAVQSVDDKLAGHLKIAEEHLIEAAKLFELKKHPNRTNDYVARLFRVQEMVTHLYREELVRIRGPIKMKKVTAVARKRKTK